VLNQATYVKDTALALWEGLPRVILAGFLFTLISLPAVVVILLNLVTPGILLGIFTVGPAWVAMSALIARVLLRESASPLDFVHALRHYYARGAILAAGLAIPLVTAAWSLPALAQPPVPTVIWLGLAADLAGFFLLSALYLYTDPQIVLYDVGVRVALRNSFILAARYLSNTLGLLGLAVLLGLLAFKVTYLLLVILPPAWMVFVINNCRMVLRLELGDDGDLQDPQDSE
jgi:uncharacterized membrane protein YesL